MYVCTFQPTHLQAGAGKGLKHITNSWTDLSRMTSQRLTGITILNVLLSFCFFPSSSLTPSHKGESSGYLPDSETPCFDLTRMFVESEAVCGWLRWGLYPITHLVLAYPSVYTCDKIIQICASSALFTVWPYFFYFECILFFKRHGHTFISCMQLD